MATSCTAKILITTGQFAQCTTIKMNPLDDIYIVRYSQQMQFNKVSKELEEIKDSTSVLRKRLAEMMNSLLSDLVSEWAWQIIFGSV